MTIQPSRVVVLNSAEPRPAGQYVLYWMQASQRASHNPALEYSVSESNRHNLPLVVCFGLTDGYPEANARHYAFMLEGLAEVRHELETRGVRFVIRRGSPDDVALGFAKHAFLVVCDRGYLKPQKSWRARVSREANCRVIQVEGEVVVPVEIASPKHEFAARTFRPKVQRYWDEFLRPLGMTKLKRRADELALASDLDLDGIPAVVASLNVDHTVPHVRRFRGGGTQARTRLNEYLSGPFESYGQNRGLPEAGAASHMSPYLHFGQISPVEIALAVRATATGGPQDTASYLEELIVRRELAVNHVFYDERYDDYVSVPQWARTTLEVGTGRDT